MRFVAYPGSYEEFRWSRDQAASTASPTAVPAPDRRRAERQAPRAARKRAAAEVKKHQRRRDVRQRRVASLEDVISEREAALKALEASMSEPGFFGDPKSANAMIAKHQTLMWEIGDLMHEWEDLQTVPEDESG